MSHAHALSALAGLVVVALGLGGLMSWQANSDTTLNVVGVFMITYRMLRMFKTGPSSKDGKGAKA